MRWKDDPIPIEGDNLEVTKFLWFPLTIKKETRWLERATIKLQFYKNRSIGGGWGQTGWFYEDWSN